MSKKWTTFLVAAVVGSLLLPTSAFAACKVTLLGPAATAFSFTDATAAATVKDPVPLVPGDKVSLVTPNTGTAGGAIINAEGVAERVSDLLITDDTLGTNFCFATGTTLTVTYSGILTNPATPGTLSVPGNLDIYDSAGIGGLTVSSTAVSLGFAANTTQSIVTIVIGQVGTTGNLLAGPAGAALRLKNMRINATTVQGALPAAVNVVFSGPGTGAAPTAVSFVNAAGTTVGTVTTATGVVGTSTATIAATVQPGVIVNGGLGGGTQSTPTGLAGTQTIGFTEGFAGSFRLAGGTCASQTVASDTCASQVANDLATVATSLVFNLTTIPSGVTVTFPSTISTSAFTGASGTAMVFTARSGTLTNAGAPGTLTVIYDATKVGTAANVVGIETADNADAGSDPAGGANPNCKADKVTAINAGSPCDKVSKIGVAVGATTLAGTAAINVAFGRGDVGTSLFTGDDIAADTTVIPRYTGATRYIVKAKNYFTIFPVRTTLLFPFVSTVGGFNTGLSVANTCADAGAFGATNTCSQTGGVVFYFFGVHPTTKAAIVTSINTDLTAGGTSVAAACRGFDANGRIAPGVVAACSVSAMLPLLTGAPTGFDGYVIAVTSFNNGHGFSAQFNGSGSPFAANSALVLGLNGAVTRVGTETLGQ